MAFILFGLIGLFCAHTSDAAAPVLEGELRYATPLKHGDKEIQVELWPVDAHGLPILVATGMYDTAKGIAPVQTITVPPNATGRSIYAFGDPVPHGNYTVLAFQRVCDGDDTRLCAGVGGGQLLGWPWSDTCIGGVEEEFQCADVVTLPGGSSTTPTLNARLRPLHPFPRGQVTRITGGVLNTTMAIPMLSLRGTAKERGYAHGYLAGEQVLDVIQTLIEWTFRQPGAYEAKALPAIKSPLVRIPEDVLDEADAMVEGISAAGSPFLEVLGRNVTSWDIIVLSALEAAQLAMQSTRGAHCTQLLAWGDVTKGTDVDGGTVTGRNLDGQNDMRKVTSVLTMVTGVEAPGRRRYVSVLYPGFIGVWSGFNELGNYLMWNMGCSAPRAGHEEGFIPTALLMRDYLWSTEIPASPSPEQVEAYLLRVGNSSLGGACLGGAILNFAAPPRPGGQYDHPGGFVYECDALGGAMRYETEAQVVLSPHKATGIVVASNHYIAYKATGSMADACSMLCNEHPIEFSSLWRYQVAANTAGMVTRAGRGFGTVEMKEALVRACHGETQMSIIVVPARLSFEIASSSGSRPTWDAPMYEWHAFHFEDAFGG